MHLGTAFQSKLQPEMNCLSMCSTMTSSTMLLCQARLQVHILLLWLLLPLLDVSGKFATCPEGPQLCPCCSLSAGLPS